MSLNANIYVHSTEDRETFVKSIAALVNEEIKLFPDDIDDYFAAFRGPRGLHCSIGIYGYELSDLVTNSYKYEYDIFIHAGNWGQYNKTETEMYIEHCWYLFHKLNVGKYNLLAVFREQVIVDSDTYNAGGVIENHTS